MSAGDAVAGELTPDELRAIATLLDAVGLPLDAWRALPGLADLLESVAIARRLTRRRRERPVAYRIALVEACALLGVKPAAHVKRVTRWAARWWPEGSRLGSRTTCPPDVPTVVDVSTRGE